MFDCYHTQIMQGDIIRRLEENRDFIGHVQIAGVPIVVNRTVVKLHIKMFCWR